MPENPGIVKRASSDADGGAAGLVEHAFGNAGGGDVAIADDRDGFDGLDNGADTGQINGAGESLLPGASMDDDASHANVFERASEIGGGQVVRIPAEPHFAGDRNLDGVHHRFDEANSLSVVR